MCTIGTVFTTEKGAMSFKQCDLEKATIFNQPVIQNGKGDIKYLPFTRVGSEGCWSGINNYGVSFVAADAYLETTGATEFSVKPVSQDIFAAYTKIISDYKSAKEAADYMCSFYPTFNQPDILLISDATSAYFIETNNGVVECIKRTENFFASTNHFRMLYGGVLYPSNHSSYLRLARAEAILERTMDPMMVLEDQYFGETVFSICRVNKNTPPQEEPYYTQATSIFYTDGKVVNCAYQINGSPRTNPYTFIFDVFGVHKKTNHLSRKEVQQHLKAKH